MSTTTSRLWVGLPQSFSMVRFQWGLGLVKMDYRTLERLTEE